MHAPVCLAALLSLAVAGCGGDTDYISKDPAEAGPELGEAACDADFECGIISVSCDMGTAVAMREPAEHLYGSRDACDTMLTTYYTDIITGCAAANLTDDERDQVNACLNSAPYCPADSELQDVADALCANHLPPGADPACMIAQPILQHCTSCAANPASC